MALRLARLFGNSPGFGPNAQQAWDTWYSERAYNSDLMQIRPIAIIM